MAEKIELQNRLREIPYNYTSFADKDIVTRLLGKGAWQLLNELRVSGKPGRSARMLYEVLGDVWVIQRNPYLQEDMLFNKKRRDLLIEALYHRINSIREQLPTLDEVSARKVAALMETALVMIEKFKGSFERSWDLRRLVPGESRLGEALLSDHSGVFWRDGQTKLSFGRSCQLATPPLDVGVVPVREAVRFAVARLMDRYLLSFSALGDPGHTPNEEILHSHLFTLANALGVPNPVGVRPERKFCKAMVVLSDSTPLGDINANLPRFVWAEQGEQFGLGKGTLSESDHRLRRVEVLERFYAQHPTALAVPVVEVTPGRSPTTTATVRARADTALGVLRLGDVMPARDVLSLTRLYSLIQAPLPDPASLRPRLYQRAQVVLCEVTLGDVNSRTPRRAIYRTRPVARLGDLTLGEAAEIEWRALTEMQICISGVTQATPYVFDDAHPSLLRLLTRSADGSTASQVSPARVPVLSTRAAWQGQTWTGVRWPASSWADTRELIGYAHSAQS